jgi:hypothetical protein
MEKSQNPLSLSTIMHSSVLGCHLVLGPYLCLYWLASNEFITMKKIFAIKIHRNEKGKFIALMGCQQNLENFPKNRKIPLIFDKNAHFLRKIKGIFRFFGKFSKFSWQPINAMNFPFSLR